VTAGSLSAQAGVPVSDRYPWDVFPSGWYAVADSVSLPPGAVLSRRVFGHEVVAFRTGAGAVGVLDAFCPHMGAHMGKGGRLEGEALRCPFHAFRFDVTGACLGTPYPGGAAPPAARARSWPATERNGVVLAWHDSVGGTPDWEVPELDIEGFGPLFRRTFVIKGHPQETTENGVDLGHLGIVHGYRDVEVLEPLRIDGPRLRVSYGASRDAATFGRGGTMRAEFTIQVHGLGCSIVDARVPALGLRSRHYVHATPIDGDRIEMRAAMRLGRLARPGQVSPLLALVPRGLAEALVARATFHGFLHDLRQDFDIWEHKRYVDPPALAPGDGPVGRYRQWARQFYTPAPQPAIP
jgi:nitrite reductase/ring-hydroxylating ferredoxin subunit